MRLLKITVIAMGVLIVVGLTTVLVTVANRFGGDTPDAVSKPSSGPTVPIRPSHLATPAPAFDQTVTLPTGATVTETVTDGARIVLRLRLADGNMALLLIDPATGKKTGLIRLKPTP